MLVEALLAAALGMAPGGPQHVIAPVERASARRAHELEPLTRSLTR